MTLYREPTLSPPVPPRWYLDLGVALRMLALRFVGTFAEAGIWLVGARGTLGRGLAPAGRAIALVGRVANGAFVGLIFGAFAGLFLGGTFGPTVGAIYGAGLGAVLGGGSVLAGVLVSVGLAAVTFGLHVSMLLG